MLPLSWLVGWLLIGLLNQSLSKLHIQSEKKQELLETIQRHRQDLLQELQKYKDASSNSEEATTPIATKDQVASLNVSSSSSMTSSSPGISKLLLSLSSSTPYSSSRSGVFTHHTLSQRSNSLVDQKSVDGLLPVDGNDDGTLETSIDRLRKTSSGLNNNDSDREISTYIPTRTLRAPPLSPVTSSMPLTISLDQ